VGLVILAAILAVGVISHNAVMVYSSSILLAAVVLGANRAIDLLGTLGVPSGVVVLIMVVLLPLVQADTSPQTLAQSLLRREGIVAVIIGILATYLGGEGVALMQASPEVVVGIVVGTTIGAVFFRGIPTGPLVAAGAVAIILRLLT